MGLQLAAPRMQEAGKAGQRGANEARVFGEAFECLGRCLEHSLVGEGGVGATEGAQCLRHREGDQEVRSWELLLELVVQPRLGFVVLTLGTMPIAAGMMDTVVLSTGGAGIEAVAVCPCTAAADGVNDLAGGRWGGADGAR